MEKLVPRGDHLIWVGGRDSHGRGVVTAGKRGTGKLRAKRVVWERHHGEIPKDRRVVTTCDVADCHAIEHLALLSHRQACLHAMKRSGTSTPHGEANPRAKLSSEEVAQIRNRAARGESVKALAAAYDTPAPTIKGILAGRRRVSG